MMQVMGQLGRLGVAVAGESGPANLWDGNLPAIATGSPGDAALTEISGGFNITETIATAVTSRPQLTFTFTETVANGETIQFTFNYDGTGYLQKWQIGGTNVTIGQALSGTGTVVKEITNTGTDATTINLQFDGTTVFNLDMLQIVVTRV